jgi:hypothetical protein
VIRGRQTLIVQRRRAANLQDELTENQLQAVPSLVTLRADLVPRVHQLASEGTVSVWLSNHAEMRDQSFDRAGNLTRRSQIITIFRARDERWRGLDRWQPWHILA